MEQNSALKLYNELSCHVYVTTAFTFHFSASYPTDKFLDLIEWV
jgi:hypothetical protein